MVKLGCTIRPQPWVKEYTDSWALVLGSTAPRDTHKYCCCKLSNPCPAARRPRGSAQYTSSTERRRCDWCTAGKQTPAGKINCRHTFRYRKPTRLRTVNNVSAWEGSMCGVGGGRCQHYLPQISPEHKTCHVEVIGHTSNQTARFGIT